MAYSITLTFSAPLNESCQVTMICDTILAGSFNGANKFILFSKDNKANLSSVLGYYAEVKLSNNSSVASEMFSVGLDMFESSGESRG